MNKSNSLVDIAQILASKAASHLSRAFTYSQQKEIYKESEACIEAVILFQASMEAVINEEIESHRLLTAIRIENEDLYKKFRSLSFKNKWERSYQSLGLEDTEQYLSHYLAFYSAYRVPITHPQSRYSDISSFKFQPIYEGIKNGWYAAHQLLTKLEKKYSQETWEDFCSKCGITLNKV